MKYHGTGHYHEAGYCLECTPETCQGCSFSVGTFDEMVERAARVLYDLLIAEPDPYSCPPSYPPFEQARQAVQNDARHTARSALAAALQQTHSTQEGDA